MTVEEVSDRNMPLLSAVSLLEIVQRVSVAVSMAHAEIPISSATF